MQISLETGSGVRKTDRFKELIITVWKVSVFGVFLVRIFPYSDWVRRDTKYLCAFSQTAGKYRPEKLQIRTLSTQCNNPCLANVPILYPFKIPANERFSVVFSGYKMGRLIRNESTHSFPMDPFSTPQKHQKTIRFSDVFRG